ncbi:hypothetical protein, partial [Pseudomonas lundensis]|uniref:hypothetical protein n=1 Tax=Pseudomonas lundensis TaxID=86185 RepID=UPI001CB75C3A
RLSLKEHHHNGDALLGTQVVVLGRHGNTLHEVLHLLLETAESIQLLVMTVTDKADACLFGSSIAMQLESLS